MKKRCIENKSWDELEARNDLVKKSYTYLRDNFHKFTEAKKIDISLKLILKSMPTEIAGQMTNTVTMPQITIDGKKLEYNVGEKVTDERDEQSAPPETAGGS